MPRRFKFSCPGTTALTAPCRYVGSMRTRPFVASNVAGVVSVAGSVSVPNATICWPTDSALASSTLPGEPVFSTFVLAPTLTSAVRCIRTT